MTYLIILKMENAQAQKLRQILLFLQTFFLNYDVRLLDNFLILCPKLYFDLYILCCSQAKRLKIWKLNQAVTYVYFTLRKVTVTAKKYPSINLLPKLATLWFLEHKNLSMHENRRWPHSIKPLGTIVNEGQFAKYFLRICLFERHQ